MLVVNDPDKMVLINVDPKNMPAARSSQRMECPLDHLWIACKRLNGLRLEARVLSEKDGKEPSKVGLLRAHSRAQSNKIRLASRRSKATFGTST